MALQDMPDLKYQAGGIAATKPFTAAAGLTASGAVSLPGATTIGGLTVADPNSAQPGDHGFVAWSYDPSFASTAQILTNGTLYLSAVRLRRSTTVAKVWWAQSAAAVTPTAGQSFACLINSAGTVLSSAGIDTQIAGANGTQNATLTAPQTNLAAGLYWVGLLANAATAPTLARTNGLLTGLNNANLAGASLRYATNGTGLTALPASVTPAGNTAGPSLWAAVS